MYKKAHRGTVFAPLHSRKLLIVSLVLLSFLFLITSSNSHGNERPLRTRLKHLSTTKLKTTAALTNLNQIIEDASKISVVRVPDTPSHENVQNFIINRISSDWEVDKITFTADTPFGVKKFTNIIAMLQADKAYLQQENLKNPPTSVVISAHYDSKYFKDFNFVASIDSAVSCSLMIDLSHTLAEPLKKTVGKRPIPILVFFDGEEAFVEWTNKDSLYGSKHLVEQWSTMKFYGEKTYLDSIETLILLDLLGGTNPRIASYFEDTTPLFDRLATIHKKIKEHNLALYTKDIFHSTRLYSANMQDDHIPFLQRGVNVLHLITIPFPSVWHKAQDTMDAVDKNVINDLSMVLRIFLMEYFQSV